MVAQPESFFPQAFTLTPTLSLTGRGSHTETSARQAE